MSIRERAMLVDFSRGHPNVRKKDKDQTRALAEANNVDEEAVLVTKRLWKGNELKQIVNKQQQCYNFHKTETIEWCGSVRLLPVQRYTHYRDGMLQYKQEIDDLVDDFIAKYEDICNESLVALNGLGDPLDYPQPEDIRRRFYFQMSLFPIPEGLRDIRLEMSENQKKEAQELAEKTIQESMNKSLKDICDRIIEVIQHISDVMHEPAARFQESTINNAVKLVTLLPQLNVMDDPLIEEVRKDIEHKLCEYTAEDIRNDDTARYKTARRADEILAKMEGYVT